MFNIGDKVEIISHSNKRLGQVGTVAYDYKRYWPIGIETYDVLIGDKRVTYYAFEIRRLEP